MTKRIFCLLLAALMILPMAACNESTPAETTGTAVTTAPTSGDSEPVAETTADPDADSLPETMDFDNAEVNILTRTGSKAVAREFAIEEITADRVEDAVYLRNEAVMDRLNIKLGFVKTDDTEHLPTQTQARIRQMNQAGTNEFNIVTNHMGQNSTCILEGCYQDITPLEYLDLGAKWWNQDFNDIGNVDGAMYQVTGEIALTMISGMYVMFFNKELWEDHNPDGASMYDIVRNKEWTMDKMIEICEGVYVDENGDGNRDDGDTYGFVQLAGMSLIHDAFSGAANLTFCELGEDGYWHMALHKDERTFLFMEKMNQLLFDSGATRLWKSESGGEMTKFAEGTTLFECWMLGEGVQKLADSDVEYGVIPLPMLDDAQGKYTSFVHNGSSVISIPRTIGEEELPLLGATLEALAAENYRAVVPEYFDVALKGRYANAPEDAEMMDLVRSTVTTNFFNLYNTQLNSISAQFRNFFGGDTARTDAASFFAAWANSVDIRVQILMDKMVDLTE